VVQQQTRTFSTLLQLVRPLDAMHALVSLANTDQITLGLKTPLEAQQPYWAMVQKRGEAYILKALHKITPAQVSQLQRPAHLALDTLIEGLQSGKSAQKIAFDAISSHLLESQTPRETQLWLNELMTLSTATEVTLRFWHDGHQGTLTLPKKPPQERIDFRAFFITLGSIEGSLFYLDNNIQANLWVETLHTKARLQSAKKALPFVAHITLKEPHTPLPSTHAIDIHI